jgi:hypothetical protein
MRNKLAVPLVLIAPLILEPEAPVTLLIMFSIVSALLKKALPLVGMENSEKLWKRFVPRVAPPSIWNPLGVGDVTIELSAPKVVSPTT